MAGATAGSPVVSQNAAAAAAAAVAAAATSQAASYNSNGAGGHTGHNAAAVAAAAAAALNNPSAAAAAAALLPGNQVGAESISLFQSPAKGATIPYRPSPSNTPTCICNSNSSSNSSINSTINSNGSTTVTLSALPTVAASAAVVAASSQQQQIQSQQADSQYSRQLLLQLPQATTQQQQQQIVSPMATQTLQISNGSNNNIPAYLGDHQQQHQSTDKMDPFVAAAMAAAAYTQPQPMIYPSMEQYIYPTSIDPFQLAGSESLKESQQLASPSSTSSSSCSNYSMMMVPPTAVPTAVGSAGQYAFYTPQTAAEVRTTTTTMWGTIAMEILVTPPTLQLNTPYPNYPCIMFCSKPSKHLSKTTVLLYPNPISTTPIILITPIIPEKIFFFFQGLPNQHQRHHLLPSAKTSVVHHINQIFRKVTHVPPFFTVYPLADS